MKRTKEDAIFSDVIRSANDYTCEICSKVSPPPFDNGMMDCSHDRSRRHKFTRWHPDNVICSCRSCHMKSTEDHDYHVESFRKIKGQETRDNMRELSYASIKLTKKEVADIYKHYKDEFKRIKSLHMEGVQGKIEIEVPEILK